MTLPTIEHLEITEVHEGVAPGDDAVFIKVHSAGAVGSYGPVSERIGAYVRGTLTSAVRGADTTDHDGLLDQLRTAARTDPSDSASWAVGAVDCAAWDLHGRLVGRSVAGLLATSIPQSSVSAYASWLSQDLSSIDDVGMLRRVAADGWSFTKWGLRRAPGDSSGEAAMRMAQAVERSAQALGTALAVDAVGTWTPSVAMDFARNVGTAGLLWLEDPLPRHDLDTYELLAATRLPLAVGERAHCDEDPVGLIQYVQPSALTLDVVGCGGLTRAVQILGVAQSQAIPIYPHGRSLVPGLHLAAAFPDAVPAVEYRLQWEPRRQRLYDIPLQPEHGRIRLPDVPGLGTIPRSTACPVLR
ncbi:enolase C-terminal domain-like protein [Streptomyces sp. NPDC055059]